MVGVLRNAVKSMVGFHPFIGWLMMRVLNTVKRDEWLIFKVLFKVILWTYFFLLVC